MEGPKSNVRTTQYGVSARTLSEAIECGIMCAATSAPERELRPVVGRVSPCRESSDTERLWRWSNCWGTGVEDGSALGMSSARRSLAWSASTAAGKSAAGSSHMIEMDKGDVGSAGASRRTISKRGRLVVSGLSSRGVTSTELRLVLRVSDALKEPSPALRAA